MQFSPLWGVALLCKLLHLRSGGAEGAPWAHGPASSAQPRAASHAGEPDAQCVLCEALQGAGCRRPPDGGVRGWRQELGAGWTQKPGTAPLP